MVALISVDVEDVEVRDNGKTNPFLIIPEKVFLDIMRAVCVAKGYTNPMVAVQTTVTVEEKERYLLTIPSIALMVSNMSDPDPDTRVC